MSKDEIDVDGLIAEALGAGRHFKVPSKAALRYLSSLSAKDRACVVGFVRILDLNLEDVPVVQLPASSLNPGASRCML